jgi:hypothetical protein
MSHKRPCNAREKLLLKETRRSAYQNGKKSEYPYVNRLDYVFRNGRFYDPAPMPAGVFPGVPKKCYANAQLLMSRRDDLIYCEGLATLDCGFTTEHAWCVTAGGIVIDNTWSPIGTVYFGVAFTKEFLEEYRQKYKGRHNVALIDNWQDEWPLIRGTMVWPRKGEA